MFRLLISPLVIILLSFAISSSTCEEYVFTFDSDTEGWLSYRDHWRWSDRSSENSTFPGENDGFVVMSDDQKSDELYLLNVTTYSGGSITVTFYGKAPFRGSSNLYLQKAYADPTQAQTLAVFDDYIGPFNKEWHTISVSLDPDDRPYILSFFCYNSREAQPGRPFQGCAIDSINLIDGEPGESTTQSQGGTTEEPDSETTESQRQTNTDGFDGLTTEGPNGVPTDEPSGKTTGSQVETTTGDIEGGTTESQGETTYGGPNELTTRDQNGVTTDRPNGPTTGSQIKTTTAGPSEPNVSKTTTTTITTTTTDKPSLIHYYNFESGSQGWKLSHMNGASWRRVQDANSDDTDFVLQVFAEEMYTGTTIAESPVLSATQRVIFVYLKVELNGSEEFEPHLIVRKRTISGDYTSSPVLAVNRFNAGASGETNPEPLENFDPLHPEAYENGYNIGVAHAYLGEKFVFSFEGTLGGDKRNDVIIREFMVVGALQEPISSTPSYDFESGVEGWNIGNMDGGKWVLTNWEEFGESQGVPKPFMGSNFLSVSRFDINSGTISIESPRIQKSSDFIELRFKYWIRSSNTRPVSLRIRLKTSGGDYDELPFLNLYDDGSTEHLAWVPYSVTLDLSALSEDESYYQIVFESELGSVDVNYVAIDDVKLLHLD